MSVIIQVVLTKYHELGDFISNRHLFLMVLEAGKSKIKELADLVSVKAQPLPRWCLEPSGCGDGRGHTTAVSSMAEGTKGQKGRRAKGS
jgi:hypothetical protein